MPDVGTLIEKVHFVVCLIGNAETDDAQADTKQRYRDGVADPG